MSMSKITPHLWFDKQAKEATEFYISLFPNSKVDSLSTIKDTPSGDCDIVNFTLAGQKFMAISAGPIFKFNPSISLTATCATAEEAQELFNKLSADGKVLMPFQEYPWSKGYGWCNDKYGLSWQVNTEAKGGQIIPSLMFTGEQFGKVEEALKFYTSVFKNAETKLVAKYEAGEGDVVGKVKYSLAMLEGQPFTLMESSMEHGFNFNEAVSFIINCADQEEVDYYWGELSARPEAEQCGWLKDKYGLSWQVVPKQMGEMMSKGTPEQLARVTQAFLKMKKFNIAELEQAYKG